MNFAVESSDNMLGKKIQDGGLKKQKNEEKNTTTSNNNIALDNIYKLSDLFFRQKNVMQSHLYNSSDKLLDEDIPNFLTKANSVFFEKVTKDRVYKYKFKFSDIGVKPPFIDMDDEMMFPSDARLRNLTYASKIVATITQIQEVTDIATGTVTSNVVGQPEYEYPIVNMPIMIRSKYCSLNLKKGHNNSECDYDPGGYYIVNGSEKVVVSLERMIENRPLVFIKKESAVKIYTVQVNSKSTKTDMMQIINIRLKKDNTMTIRVPILNEIPVFILMRALGIESDSDIINYCVYDSNDIDMIGMVRMSLEQTKNEKGVKILSQTDAINYLMTKMRIIKKYTETDKETKQKEKKLHLLQLLKDNMLPHVDNNYTEKAFYIGYMINRLLHCKLGRIPIDDRDSYINKRIDLPGQLIFELFKQYYKKMLNECNKFFKKRNADDEKPLNVINQIKPNIIDQGLKTALLTGNWGKKKGVAQMLQRLTYLQTLASLRRINSPTADSSTNKLTAPRHLHPSIIGPICHCETSEGHKVGLVKNLSQIGSVTVVKNSQFDHLKGILKQKVRNIQDVPINQYGRYTRVLLDGEIIGLTDSPRKLYYELKQMKYNGAFDQLVGIAHDIRSEIECKDLRINCDTGRIYHPTIRVEENEIKLSKEIIDLISEEGTENATKIISWNQFMMKFPGVIEYIDSDEKANAMMAMYPRDVEEMRMRMNESTELVKKLEPSDFTNIVNRYDRFTYVKYTHCEIDPNLLLGVVVANIPFLECNQGPRNIYQYSQARQAMGIYATNYRDRLDISYILYHPQRPIVTTRSMKYINTDKIPAGENCIVAIACYGGWNQEDSNFMSKAAIDYGLFRSTSVKKYMTTIQKNQSTSQDDIFIKPDRSQVAGMRHGSYDKLNEKGYAPEETRLENGDILIGKVSPIQAVGNSNKLFKDSSEHYKSHIPGTVDKVYTDIFNHEGYEMRKVRVRSERVPIIGDKFCSRSAQKGTNGIQLSASDMMFSGSNGIQVDLILNTNAIPSRMTIGQLIECLCGKVAAMSGTEIDGSGFSNFDLNDIKNKLKSFGYREDGTEFMRNGMTGKKMNIPIFVGPTYYQRLKHMVADKIHCLTMDHEVLTYVGWKTFNKITIEDQIATLKDGKLVYDKPINLLYYPDFEGKLYHIKTQEIDLQVTDNHRMWVSIFADNKWLPYDLIEAKNIVGQRVKYQGLYCEIEINSDNIIVEELVDTKCPVFCLQVPSEVFFVRRNGLAVWTGNSRSRGPQTILTRQPPEGRARDGGLRYGEMERDACLGHGVAKFLKERLLETADIYHCYVCNQCGLFAQRMLRKDNKAYPTKKDIYFCQACRNYTDISKIRIPYAFKLLIQELMAMNICPRIKTKRNAYE
ncbi:DNA-directed RNA polymerase subunit beta [Indivirus ILV1]|uniref:DNA-directed RNA polymerase subunit beta n=1 Tax=Indivirus ILV1 TaxID=1977633 RepID=A0A1V0SCN0_9VIRU|nr:DNA-directed RNA polymerase subunit beta [Indivirus ILV1]